MEEGEVRGRWEQRQKEYGGLGSRRLGERGHSEEGFCFKGSTHHQPGSGMWQLAPCSVTSLPCLRPTPGTLT